MVVEGAGGVMVPISRTFFMIHLIKKLQLPALVICSPTLGTLNHTLLTIAALKQAGIPLAGVIMNNYQGKTRAEQTNPQVLQKILDRKILVVPHKPAFKSDFDALARHLVKEGLLNLPYLP